MSYTFNDQTCILGTALFLEHITLAKFLKDMAKIGNRILGNGNVDQFLNLLERGKALNYLRKNIQESTNFNLILWMYDRHKQQLTIKDNLSQS